MLRLIFSSILIPPLLAGLCLADEGPQSWTADFAFYILVCKTRAPAFSISDSRLGKEETRELESRIRALDQKLGSRELALGAIGRLASHPCEAPEWFEEGYLQALMGTARAFADNQPVWEAALAAIKKVLICQKDHLERYTGLGGDLRQYKRVYPADYGYLDVLAHLLSGEMFINSDGVSLLGTRTAAARFNHSELAAFLSSDDPDVAISALLALAKASRETDNPLWPSHYEAAVELLLKAQRSPDPQAPARLYSYASLSLPLFDHCSPDQLSNLAWTRRLSDLLGSRDFRDKAGDENSRRMSGALARCLGEGIREAERRRGFIQSLAERLQKGEGPIYAERGIILPPYAWKNQEQTHEALKAVDQRLAELEGLKRDLER